MSDANKPAPGTMFDRCNLADLQMEYGPQHDGVGEIFFRTIAGPEQLDGPCNFIDYAEVPPGCSIGQHQHPLSEEEFYLIIDGDGEMQRDGESFPVRKGDLIRNNPGGTHGLLNMGPQTVKLFVINLRLPQ